MNYSLPSRGASAAEEIVFLEKPHPFFLSSFLLNPPKRFSSCTGRRKKRREGRDLPQKRCDGRSVGREGREVVINDPG